MIADILHSLEREDILRLVCKFLMQQKESRNENIAAAGSPKCSISWLMGSSNIDTIPISLIPTFSHWNGNQSHL